MRVGAALRGTGLAACAALVTGLLAAPATAASGDLVPVARSGTQMSLSANGSIIAYQDDDADRTLYVRNLVTGVTTRVDAAQDGTPANGQSGEPSISADGTRVSFYSSATNLDPSHAVSPGNALIYAKNLVDGSVQLVSYGPAGLGGTSRSQISGNGQRVVFTTYGRLLADDTNGRPDVYVRDLTSGDLTRLSDSLPLADPWVYEDSVSISDGGSLVAFVVNDGNPNVASAPHVFVKNLSTGTLSEVTTPDNAVGYADLARISGDGSHIAVVVRIPSVRARLWVVDLATGQSTLASISNTGQEPDSFGIDWISISDDGARVAFQSGATNLDPADPDSLADIYVRDIPTGELQLASLTAGGVKGNTTSPGNYGAVAPVLSPDGTTVAFLSSASNLGVTPPRDTYFYGYVKTLQPFAVPAPSAITSGASVSVGLRAPLAFTVTTSGSPRALLSESGALPLGVTFTDSGDGTARLAGAPAVGTLGSYPITITAFDGVGDPVTQSFVLTVTSAKSAPALTSGATVTATFGVAFSFGVSTTGYPVPKITRSGALPPGVTFADNGDGTAMLSGTPTKAASGIYTFTLTAKNSQGSGTQVVSMTVLRAATIATVKPQRATVGVPFSVTITASGYTTPVLEFGGGTRHPLPAGLTFADNGNGTATIAGTPTAGTGGTYAPVVTAQNDTGSAAVAIALTINEAPAFAGDATATATIGTAFSYQLEAIGFPQPNFSKTGTLPRGVTFDAASGRFSGTPKSGTAGSYPIQTTAKNAVGSVTRTFTIIVS